MAKRKLRTRTISTALAFAAATGAALAPRTAAAYGPEGHQRVTDLAWQVMNATQHKDEIVFQATTPPDLTAVPAGVNATEWAQFLATVRAATERLPDVRAGTDPPVAPASACTPQKYPTLLETIRECRLAELGFAPTKDWKISDVSGCQANTLYRPGGIYDDFADSLRSPYMGMLLGRLANEPDNDRGDLTIWVRAHTSHLTPIGPALEGLSTGAELFLTAFFALPLCAEAIITGENCLDKAAQLADDANLVEEAIGRIPGVLDTDNLLGLDIMGLWHFLHLQAPAGEYNDVRGMHFDYAGPRDSGGNNQPGVIDVAFSAISDIFGYGIRVSESTGIRRYEGTKERSVGDWQAPNLGHVEMNPLDNFADWGWRTYIGQLGNPKANLGYLARPLHAFGDVSIPGHVLGTVGWGHAPLEDAVESNWPALVLQEDYTRRAYSDAEKLLQLAQARRILEEGFRWWKWVKTYKESHPGVDIPVSAWINAIAQETLAKAGPYLSDEASTLSALNLLFQKVHGDEALEAFAQVLVNAWVASINQAISGFGGGMNPITAPDVEVGGLPNLFDKILPIVRQRIEASAGAKLAFLSLVGANYAQPLPPTETTPCAGLPSSCPADKAYAVDGECHPCPAGQVQSAGACQPGPCPAGQSASEGVCVPGCDGDRPFSLPTGSTAICVRRCSEGFATIDEQKTCTTIDQSPDDLPPIGPIK